MISQTAISGQNKQVYGNLFHKQRKTNSFGIKDSQKRKQCNEMNAFLFTPQNTHMQALLKYVILKQ